MPYSPDYSEIRSITIVPANVRVTSILSPVEDQIFSTAVTITYVLTSYNAPTDEGLVFYVEFDKEQNAIYAEQRILADVQVEYSIDGGDSWHICSSLDVEANEGTNDLLTSSDGTQHTFVWDAASDVKTNIYITEVYIRIKAYDGNNWSDYLTSPKFTINTLPEAPEYNADSYVEGELVADTTPEIHFTIPTDIGADELYFKIQLDISGNFTSSNLLEKNSLEDRGFWVRHCNNEDEKLGDYEINNYKRFGDWYVELTGVTTGGTYAFGDMKDYFRHTYLPSSFINPKVLVYPGRDSYFYVSDISTTGVTIVETSDTSFPQHNTSSSVFLYIFEGDWSEYWISNIPITGNSITLTFGSGYLEYDDNGADIPSTVTTGTFITLQAQSDCVLYISNRTENSITITKSNSLGNPSTGDTFTLFILQSPTDVNWFSNVTAVSKLARFESSYSGWKKVRIINNGDNVVCLSTGGTLQILDISDKSNPSVVSTTAVTASTPYDMIVTSDEDYIFIVDSDTLYKIDISNLSSPTVTSTSLNVETAQARSLALSDDESTIFIAGYWENVPGNGEIQETGYGLLSYGTDLVYNDYVLISDTDTSSWTADIIKDIMIIGDNAYVAVTLSNGNGYIFEFDVNDPESMEYTESNSIGARGCIRLVKYSNDYFFAIFRIEGYKLLDTSYNTIDVYVSAPLDTIRDATLDVSRNYLFIASANDNQLTVLNVSNLSNPEEVDYISKYIDVSGVTCLDVTSDSNYIVFANSSSSYINILGFGGGNFTLMSSLNFDTSATVDDNGEPVKSFIPARTFLTAPKNNTSFYFELDSWSEDIYYCNVVMTQNPNISVVSGNVVCDLALFGCNANIFWMPVFKLPDDYENEKAKFIVSDEDALTTGTTYYYRIVAGNP